MIIYSGISHLKWWFPIVMLVYQRVPLWKIWLRQLGWNSWKTKIHLLKHQANMCFVFLFNNSVLWPIIGVLPHISNHWAFTMFYHHKIGVFPLGQRVFDSRLSHRRHHAACPGCGAAPDPGCAGGIPAACGLGITAEPRDVSKNVWLKNPNVNVTMWGESSPIIPIKYKNRKNIQWLNG